MLWELPTSWRPLFPPQRQSPTPTLARSPVGESPLGVRMVESPCIWCSTEATSARWLAATGPWECPFCDHVFKGNGWDGIDAHWRSKHEPQGTTYEEFWASLCSNHR